MKSNTFINIIKPLAGSAYILSDIIQFIKLYNSPNIGGFEPLTYILFILVNFSGFIFANNIYSADVILAYMGPVFVDALIVAYALHKEKKKKTFIFFLVGFIMFTLIYFAIIFNHPKLINKYSSYFGFVGAFLIPLSIILQIIKVYKNKNSKGISKSSWILQCVGNAALYFVLGKYTDLSAISVSLFSGVLSFILIVLCYKY